MLWRESRAPGARAGRLLSRLARAARPLLRRASCDPPQLSAGTGLLGVACGDLSVSHAERKLEWQKNRTRDKTTREEGRTQRGLDSSRAGLAAACLGPRDPLRSPGAMASAQAAKVEKMLKAVQKLPGNKTCMDCCGTGALARGWPRGLCGVRWPAAGAGAPLPQSLLLHRRRST